MEIVKEFGINPTLLVAQVINFLIILFLLKKFLYKPMLDTLKKRKDAIEQGIKNAEQVKLLLEKTAEKEKQVLKHAQDDARKLIEEAKKQKDEILQVADKKAKKHAEDILKEAQNQIIQSAKETEKRLTLHISEISLLFLQKSLSGILSQKQQDEIVKTVAQKMKKESN